MGVTTEDFIRTGRYLEMPDAEWEQELATRKRVVSCYQSNDHWAVKIKKNVGVLLTASVYGLPYLKASVESHKKLGYWTVLAYDNFIDPDNGESNIDYNRFMPPKDIMNQVDTFLLPHHQCWGGVSYPFIWMLRLASGIFHSFDYVLVNNGDMVLEKPENFDKLIEKMGDADIMSSGPSLPREIGTAGILFKSSAFMKVAKHMNDHMVPFSEYEKSTQEFGNTEGRLAVAVRDLNLKQVICRHGACPTHGVCEQLHVPGGEWYDIIGMRHIHGELNYAYRYKQMPPPARYLDERFCGGEDIKAAKAYEAGDTSFVKSWWARD